MVDIIPSAKLSQYTTFQLGAECSSLILCETPEELDSVVQKLSNDTLPFILIGGGSNLVVSDQKLECNVIRYVTETPDIKQDGNEVWVSGSTILDDLVKSAAENALEGVNYASGIPGTVGGAIVGNAGAFGKQIGDVLKSITLIDKEGNIKEVGPETLAFSYRYSNLRESDEIVVACVLSLYPGDKEQLLKEREEILQTRREKHPDLSKEPCAGSFFRNIEPTSKADRRQATGYFLDQAGGKELTSGGAYICPKHANIILKGENCSAEDVYFLSQEMAALAKEKFDLDLVREVKFVGNFSQKPSQTQSIIW